MDQLYIKLGLTAYFHSSDLSFFIFPFDTSKQMFLLNSSTRTSEEMDETLQIGIYHKWGT